jgi:DNA-binding MurR/RpiR family transcriptional regulator
MYPALKSAERRAADFLLHHPSGVEDLNIVDFAASAGCSEATVVRLAQRLGYAGFPDLKKEFARRDTSVPYPNLDPHESPETIARKIFASSIQALRDTLEVIDVEQYRAAVAAYLRARRLAFFGLGNAAVVAREAYQKFLRIGLPSFTAEDADLQLLITGVQLERGDVLTAISHSGESRPIIQTARQAKSRGILVVAITNYPRSTLARLADCVLLTAVFQEHVNGEVAAKRLAQLCVIETLYVNVLLRRGPAVCHNLAAANRALAINKRSPGRPPAGQGPARGGAGESIPARHNPHLHE